MTSPLVAWISAARPQTLPVAVAPVAVGAAIAANVGGVRWDAVLVALLGALTLQIGTNFANDVFDFEKGADDDQRLGPPRAVQSGWLTPRAVRRGMWVAFGAAFLCGIWLTYVAGPVIVAIGIASILSGLAYTGGPYPLGYNGLGDVFVLLFFGFVAVAGTAFVASGHVPALAWLAAVPVGALATAVLVVNNARDMSTDARVGKRTLAVRFGRRFANLEYGGLVVAAYAAVVVAVALHLAPPLALIALVPAPFALALTRRFVRTEGAALNPMLPQTAKLLLATAALLAIGIGFGGGAAYS